MPAGADGSARSCSTHRRLRSARRVDGSSRRPADRAPCLLEKFADEFKRALRWPASPERHEHHSVADRGSATPAAMFAARKHGRRIARPLPRSRKRCRAARGVSRGCNPAAGRFVLSPDSEAPRADRRSDPNNCRASRRRHPREPRSCNRARGKCRMRGALNFNAECSGSARSRSQSRLSGRCRCKALAVARRRSERRDRRGYGPPEWLSILRCRIQ